ncbi:MAG: hypothetical protein ACXWQ5_00225 [Ktedonobacterales bacterium]
MIRELVALIPPTLVGQIIPTTPAKTLSTCRIFGSNDATYGAVGWVPPTDGSTFATLKTREVTNTWPETNRVWSEYTIEIFIGIVHGDTPNVAENYNDEALAWADLMVQVVASNRRLLPGSGTIAPTMGDVCWDYKSGVIRERHPVYNIPYYGLDCTTCLRVVQGVNYQY